MARAGRCLLAALLLAVAACSASGPANIPLAERRPGPIDAAEGRWAQQFHWVPVVEAGGARRLILARTCRPPREGARRLVVINHGKSPVAAETAALVPASCETEAVRWFLDRGFAVILPLRRGYGASVGPMAERYPACAPSRDYTAGALETARDIRAAIAYATTLPGIAPDRVVVVGQSAGGLGTVALSSLNEPRIAALVNMAGGDGGHFNRVALAVCEKPALLRAMARFGSTARVPMLWVYAANDSYFDPDLARAMHRAYVAAGGQARLEAVPAWGTDGHLMFAGRGGSSVWGPLVEGYLGLKANSVAGSTLVRH
jgi:dienelactone hydrolase